MRQTRPWACRNPDVTNSKRAITQALIAVLRPCCSRQMESERFAPECLACAITDAGDRPRDASELHAMTSCCIFPRLAKLVRCTRLCAARHPDEHSAMVGIIQAESALHSFRDVRSICSIGANIPRSTPRFGGNHVSDRCLTWPALHHRHHLLPQV